MQMDRYTSFEMLTQYEQHGTDYRVRWRLGSSGIAILSIHGGDIEPGTTRLADAIAAHDHSFYAFEGIKNAGNRALHITSTRFDEPIALQIVRQSDIIITIHGCAEMTPLVHLGGLDEEIKHVTMLALRQSDFNVICEGPPFAAIDQKNICNLCGRGMGVQIEISRGLRTMMYRDLTPEGRHHRTEVFTRFTAAIRQAIAPFAVIYSENRPLENTD
jgi:phage replication-related protein YjqB (UPF0714/DUF867 family)